MELLLIRHGDAAMVAGPDDLRPLTPHGETQVAAMAAWLEQLQWFPGVMMVSPYMRAQSTARPLKSLWSQSEIEESEYLTPDSPMKVLLECLENHTSERVVLVSHNPLMSNLLNWLLTEKQIRVMGTASMALLDVNELEQGCASLRWLRHPPEYQAEA